MTVAELIATLSEYPQDLPVCLGDWNEQYCPASEAAAEIVFVVTAPYWRSPSQHGPLEQPEMIDEYLQIGEGRD